MLSANSSKKRQPKASTKRTTTVSGRGPASAPSVSRGKVRGFGSPVSAASIVHGMREKQYDS